MVMTSKITSKFVFILGRSSVCEEQMKKILTVTFQINLCGKRGVCKY